MVDAALLFAGTTTLAALIVFIAGLYVGWRFGRTSQGLSPAIALPVYADQGPADIDEGSVWDDVARKEQF